VSHKAKKQVTQRVGKCGCNSSRKVGNFCFLEGRLPFPQHTLTPEKKHNSCNQGCRRPLAMVWPLRLQTCRWSWPRQRLPDGGYRLPMRPLNLWGECLHEQSTCPHTPLDRCQSMATRARPPRHRRPHQSWRLCFTPRSCPLGQRHARFNLRAASCLHSSC
jgi:hypothetical protein